MTKFERKATMTVIYEGKEYTHSFKFFKVNQKDSYMKSWLKDALCAIIHGEVYNEKNYYDEKIRKELIVKSFDSEIVENF